MVDISDEISGWLSTLWDAGVEKGQEIDLVHKSLELCVEIVREAENCGSR